VLVDTSAWIEFFRRPALPGFDIDEAVTCLPVIQEVLQGIRDEVPFRVARQAMFALPVVESPMSEELVLDAVNLYRLARRRGLTIRSSVDCLVAACAIRHDLLLLHLDRDYDVISEIAPLRTTSIKF